MTRKEEKVGDYFGIKGTVDLFLFFSVFAQTSTFTRCLPFLVSTHLYPPQSFLRFALSFCHLTLPEPDPSLSSSLLSLIFKNRFSSAISQDAHHPESLIKLLPNVYQQQGGQGNAAVLLWSVQI